EDRVRDLSNGTGCIATSSQRVENLLRDRMTASQESAIFGPDPEIIERVDGSGRGRSRREACILTKHEPLIGDQAGNLPITQEPEALDESFLCAHTKGHPPDDVDIIQIETSKTPPAGQLPHRTQFCGASEGRPTDSFREKYGRRSVLPDPDASILIRLEGVDNGSRKPLLAANPRPPTCPIDVGQPTDRSDPGQSPHRRAGRWGVYNDGRNRRRREDRELTLARVGCVVLEGLVVGAQPREPLIGPEPEVALAV